MMGERITVRVHDDDLDAIDALVDDDEFRNRSHVVRTAVDLLVKRHRSRVITTDGGEATGSDDDRLTPPVPPSEQTRVDADDLGSRVLKREREDVEFLAVAPIDGLHHVPDDADVHVDAVATSLVDADSGPVFWAGACLLERGTLVEIKACAIETGAAQSPGRWFFKGRDSGQHSYLKERDGIYLLAVYREVRDQRELVALIFVPAVRIGDLLEGRWYDSGRREGVVGKLRWTHVLDEDDLDAWGEL